MHQLVAEFEALIASDLAHPGIAAPLGTGLSGVSAYLAQDFIAADSLDVVVRDSGSSSRAEVVRVALQLASALDFAAGAETLHGALHPRDVLMSADDVRMTGLGVTRALERTGVSAPVRRPYTAPERAAGHAWDHRADVFSLAALMFELLCAKRVSGVGEQAADAMPDIVGSNRAELRRMFARALAENPSDRFESAGAFADALQMAVGEMPAMASSPAGARRRVLTPPTQGELALPLDASDRGRDDRARETPAVEAARPTLPDIDLHIRETPTASSVSAPRAVDVPEEAPELEPARAPFRARLETEPAAERTERAESAMPSILSEGALETTRSAVWPLMLALVVGIAIGFGIAMAFVARSPDTQTAAVQSPSRPANAPDGPPPAPAPVPPSPGPSDLSRDTSRPDAQPARPGGAAVPRAATPPAPIRGTVIVRSTPPGAQVFLDGKRAGTTPVTLRDLARGSHAVRLARDGYIAVERQVSVSASRTSQTLAVELARPRAGTSPAPPSVSAGAARAVTGAIAVDSRPAGASVFIDDKLVGTTPLVVEAIGAGEHSVRLELATFRPWSSAVTVVGGQRSRVAGSLEQLP